MLKIDKHTMEIEFDKNDEFAQQPLVNKKLSLSISTYNRKSCSGKGSNES